MPAKDRQDNQDNQGTQDSQDDKQGEKQMENKIKKLPQEIISKIAAGEVVINPASVVKELVENSLDALATRVEIQIRNGGKSYIKVSDNGIGMSKDDLLLSVERYTTSKITRFEDIYNIFSYGFRGEALASIGEVSRLVIISARADKADEHLANTPNTPNPQIIAHKLEFIGGKVVRSSQTYRQQGTTVEVHDLFFNIPARRKFLSSDKIETRMVTETIEKFILARPDVHFVLKIEDEVIYNAKAGALEDRFSIIFPEVKEFRIIEDEKHYDSKEEFSEYFKIAGVISSPQYVRKNRTGQIFFVNKRFVMDNFLNLALERGYGETLAQGEHPYAAIFLEFTPDKIDVNIHPQKLQVKFSNPQSIYNSVARIIRENVRKFSGYKLLIEKKQIKEQNFESPAGSNQWNMQSDGVLKQLDVHQNYRNHQSSDYADYKDYYKKHIHQEQNDQNNLNSLLLMQDLRSISIKEFLTIKNRYILFEDIDGIAIIDFHAAHERILYERLKNKSFESVPLLIPVHIKLSKSLLQLANQLFEEFKDLGFSFSTNKLEDGSGEVEIAQIPSILKVTEAAEVFLEVLEEYAVPFERPETLKHALAAKACKAAVRTNDKLSNDEVKQLIEEIKAKNLLTCPHGRPILMKLPFSQLDGYFERI